MSQELHYTSVARGLKPGSRGFGTVAATANLPEALVDRLEASSAYQAVFPPGDPSEALNPVAFVHVRVAMGGEPREVVSRIGPAGLDYSGRPNKYAHHVILEPGERPEGGPAWLMGQPGFLRDAWAGEPRTIDVGPSVPQGDLPAGIARAWQSLTGDAGWAGLLAESFLADPRRPTFLVFRPGMELLPLFAEAIALLPPSRRWDVEFSTYLTTLPPGISCTWRGVLDGSRQAKEARRLPNALILDLGRPLGRASGGGLVHLARTGQRLEAPERAGESPSRIARGAQRPPAVTAGPPPPSRDAGDRDWLPDLAAQLAIDTSLLGGDALRRPSRRRRRAVIAVLIAFVLVAPIAAIALSPAVRRAVGLESAPVPVALRDRARPIAPAGADIPTARTKPHEAPPVEARKPRGDAVAKSVPPAKDLPAPPVAAVPTPPPPTTPVEPLLLAFDTPKVIRSALFGNEDHKDAALGFPEDTEADHLEILNAQGFAATRDHPPGTWDIATRSSSGIAGGVALAKLSRKDARTWQFEWTDRARTQSSQVEALRDAVLKLRGRGGRPIYVLLRDVELQDEHPLVAWDNQKILADKHETRTRTVDWPAEPDVLVGSRWKPVIRRWRISVAATGEDRDIVRVIEPDRDGPDAGPSLESDLVPDELKLKLFIEPSRPAEIAVRIEAVSEKIQEGRRDRAARREELAKATPKDGNAQEQDPIKYRRAQLQKLRDDGANDRKEIRDLEREIDELERLGATREMEDLLAGPSRAELSLVIGLEVEGAGLLDIARIGEFAGDR